MSIHINRVISGGQTGADQGGLEAAYNLGIKTGGTAPANYLTESGVNLELRDKYGLVQSKSSNYPPRTKANVRDADVTLWFGDYDSPGGKLTTRYAESIGKEWMIGGTYNLRLPVPQSITDSLAVVLYDICMERGVTRVTLNIAGNRESRNPGIQQYTRASVTQLITTFNTRYGPEDKKVAM